VCDDKGLAFIIKYHTVTEQHRGLQAWSLLQRDLMLTVVTNIKMVKHDTTVHQWGRIEEPKCRSDSQCQIENSRGSQSFTSTYHLLLNKYTLSKNFFLSDKTLSQRANTVGYNINNKGDFLSQHVIFSIKAETSMASL